MAYFPSFQFARPLTIPPFNLFYPSLSPLILHDGFLSPLPTFPIDGLNTHFVPSRPASPMALPSTAIFTIDLLDDYYNTSDVKSLDITCTTGKSPAATNSTPLAPPRPVSPTENPQRPPIRPNPTQRSNFALEPNPFEQFFSRTSHHSQSSVSDRTTPPRGGEATSIKHNTLPPLSSLTSPAAADPSQFPWLANHSLRTGPLSPAMLAGPQPLHDHHPNHNPSNLRPGANAENSANAEGGFDSNTFRTGFTPGTGSGFTPGYGALMNGNFSSLPMPSPNTAAFLNMVTNSTPLGEGGDGGPSNPQGHHVHDGQHPHPPSAIPPHLQHHGLSHLHGHSDVQQETITPNTLSALTGVFNDMNRANGNAPHPSPAQYFSSQNMRSHGPSPVRQVDYAQQSANAASQAANGLFLLSQAHQELSKREEAEGRQGSPVTAKKTAISVGPAGSGKLAIEGGGQKRKSDAGPSGKPIPAKKGKKNGVSSTPTPDMMTKMESRSPSFSMGTDDDMGDMGDGDNKNETEEEKRKNFLERNRQGTRIGS